MNLLMFALKNDNQQMRVHEMYIFLVFRSFCNVDPLWSNPDAVEPL